MSGITLATGARRDEGTWLGAIDGNGERQRGSALFRRSRQWPVPLVLVHGSWGSHRGWDLVAPRLAESFRVVTYDRRGHSDSERPAKQGSVHEDVADLAAVIEHLRLGQAWVIGNSFGASIALRLTGERPDLLRGVIAHEPPLFALLASDATAVPMLDEVGKRVSAEVERIASGDHVGAAEQFVETAALGPGTWARLPSDLQQTFIHQERADIPRRGPGSRAARLRPGVDTTVPPSGASHEGRPKPADIRGGGREAGSGAPERRGRHLPRRGPHSACHPPWGLHRGGHGLHPNASGVTSRERADALPEGEVTDGRWTRSSPITSARTPPPAAAPTPSTR